MKRGLVAGLVVACLATCMVGSANAAIVNLLENGDFSTGDFTYWSTGAVKAVDIKAGWGPYTNHVQYDSASGNVGTLAQYFDVPVDAKMLVVKFDYRANFGESSNGDPWYDPISNAIDPSGFFSALVNLDAAGQPGQFNINQVVLDTNMTTHWTSVYAHVDVTSPLEDKSNNARIWFRWNEGSDWISQAQLDNVFVGVAPEPSTMALFGIGLFGLVLAGLRRRRKA